MVQRTTYVAFALHDGWEWSCAFVFIYHVYGVGVAREYTQLNEDQKKQHIK